MNTRQKYLMAMTITTAAGLLLAQQAPDSNATPPVAQSADSTAALVKDTADSSAAPALDSTRHAAVSSPATVKDSGKPVEPVLLIKSKKDTVILITDEHNIQKILKNVSSSVKKSRVQGYGGGGGFSSRIVSFDLQPAVDMIARGYPRSNLSFTTLKEGYQPFLMTGGLGYGGLGQGIRIGGGGYGGSSKYISNKFREQNATTDSSVVIDVSVSFGGMLIEKTIVKNNWNYYFGSFIGGGSLKMHPEVISASSVFSETWKQENTKSDIEAGFMSMEFHGGFTYTIVPWMHIGGDFNGLFYYSPSGFEQPWSTSFYGAAPGIGFRVIFGNIG